MVYHILANGTITKDITGHVVKVKDAEAVYNLMSKIGSGRREEAICKKSKKTIAS